MISFVQNQGTMTKNKLWIGASIMISMFMFSCGGQDEEASKKDDKKSSGIVDKSCVYSYDDSASSLQWTAFKTTERLAVKGSFDSIVVQLSDTAFSPKQALRNASFDIFTGSVFTDNPARDLTIKTYFFATFLGDGNITGEVKIVEGNDEEGGGTVKIKMNDVTRDVGFTYTIFGNKILLKTKINLNSFSGEAAITSLNTQCDEVHKGPDGISKLWPDLEIEVKAVLIKTCK